MQVDYFPNALWLSDHLDPAPWRIESFWPAWGHTIEGDPYCVLPHWLILLLTAPWPLWWLAKQRKLTRRRLAGLCDQCGYDLRASGERCPECGAAR